VEPRKYSTGTKGRLKMHADQCREAIHANSPNFSLAVEFIESIDSEKEDRVWQRFQTPEDVLPELEAWLSGGEMPAEKPKIPLVPASRLPVVDAKLAGVLKDARGWVRENAESLSALAPLDAIERVLARMEGRG
jgi:hypothetical protein